MVRAWWVGAALAMLAGLTPAADAQAARMDLTAAQLRDGAVFRLQDTRPSCHQMGQGLQSSRSLARSG
jgi:hypothetical protein